MSRKSNFLKGLGSGYVLLACNVITTLASLPLALHFLDKSEYTVWLITAQIISYLSMIEVGTTGAGIRLLVDYKDAPDRGTYGSLIKSMWLLSLLQAGLILAIGLGGAGFLMSLLKNIPTELNGEFRRLWIWQVIFLAVNFALRIGNQILQAHQRMDVSNYAQVGSLILNLVVLWGGFQAGFGLNSFILAQGVSMLLMLIVMCIACVRLKLLPAHGAWDSCSNTHFRQLFRLGSDFFWVTIGTTLTTGSQVFLLTRLLNPEAALVAVLIWSVMTKLFTLGTQIVWRVAGVATLAFSEMIVRGETDRLWKRYRSMLELTMLASAYFGLLIAFGNNAFVEIWTRKSISWSALNNWLLAGWFLLLTQACCHTSLILYHKQAQRLKVVYLIEGVAFVLLNIFVIPRSGITGMLLCSIACSALLTGPYLTHRVAKLIRRPSRVVVIEWFRPLARFFVVMVPFGVVLAWATRDSAWLRMLGCVVPVAILGAFVAVRYCLPCDLLDEMLTHVPKTFQKTAERLVGRRVRPSNLTL